MKTEAEIQHDRIHGVEPKNETTARRVPRYSGQQTSMSDIVAERGNDPAEGREEAAMRALERIVPEYCPAGLRVAVALHGSLRAFLVHSIELELNSRDSAELIEVAYSVGRGV